LTSQGQTFTTPELDAQEAAIKKQIGTISQRLGNNVAGQDYSVLDQQKAAKASLQPSWWDSLKGGWSEPGEGQRRHGSRPKRRRAERQARRADRADGSGPGARKEAQRR
jgi:hypothetical protein